MFGLPGAALAMIHMARPAQKKVAIGILSAAGLTAFLTGVTEPLEFAFMFVAFPLYLIHAALTGLSLAIAHALNIHLGFSFSAGLVDLLLYGTAPAAQNIPLLLVMGAVFFVLYYVMFRFAIVRWNMRTPGREPEAEFDAEQAANLTDDAAREVGSAGADSPRAEQLIAAFGGRDNLIDVDACITRLRMEVSDKSRVSHARLKALGAARVIEVGNNVQAIFGTQADALKNEINAALAGAAPAQAPRGTTTTVTAPAQAHPRTTTTTVVAPVQGRAVALDDVPDQTFAAGMVGPGLAIDPPRGVVEAVAPVSGRLMQLWPHAYVILTADKVGVLVHLGLDTVRLKGEGCTLHAVKGDQVVQGQPIITYDVPAVEATGRNPIIPIVVMDTKASDLDILTAPGAAVSALDALFTVTR